MAIPGPALATTAIHGIGLAALQSITIKPRRRIGPIQAQVTMREHHTDEINLTQHPVEQGATISDHAYKLPARLSIQVGWSNSPSPANTGIASLAGNMIAGLASTIRGFGSSGNYVNDIYARLLQLQASLIPFDVLTARRIYKNMMFMALSCTTDEKTAEALIVYADFQEVIIVNTQTVVVPPRESQKQPDKTTPIQDTGLQQPGPAPNYIPGTLGE